MRQHTKVIDHWGGSEGPLGFPMKSAVAKALEGVLAKLSGDCKDLLAARGGICRTARMPETVELLPGELADVSLITTEAKDLDNECLFAEGGDWTYWEQNGKQVPWCHRYDCLPVGEGLWIKVATSAGGMAGWKGKTRYHAVPDWWDAPKAEWFPAVVAHYVLTLNLRGKSIGFIPLEMRKPTQKDLEARPWLEGASWVFPKWLGLEWSVAPIQSNPEAVRLDVKRAKLAGVAAPAELLLGLGLKAEDIADEPPPEPELPPKAPPLPKTPPPPQQQPAGLTTSEARAMIDGAFAKALDEMPAMLGDQIARARGQV